MSRELQMFSRWLGRAIHWNWSLYSLRKASQPRHCKSYTSRKLFSVLPCICRHLLSSTTGALLMVKNCQTLIAVIQSSQFVKFVTQVMSKTLLWIFSGLCLLNTYIQRPKLPEKQNLIQREDGFHWFISSPSLDTKEQLATAFRVLRAGQVNKQLFVCVRKPH